MDNVKKKNEGEEKRMRKKGKERGEKEKKNV